VLKAFVLIAREEKIQLPISRSDIWPVGSTAFRAESEDTNDRYALCDTTQPTALKIGQDRE
jgi:hypothetical protein